MKVVDDKILIDKSDKDSVILFFNEDISGRDIKIYKVTREGKTTINLVWRDESH